MRWRLLEIMALCATLTPLAGCGGGVKTTAVQPTGAQAQRADALMVHVAPRSGAGVAVVHLRVPGGSLHETPDHAGAAHAAAQWVLGDRDRGLQAAIGRIGGVARAWTSREATVFEIVVARSALDPALTALAQAITGGEVDGKQWMAMRDRLDAAQHQARRSDPRRALEASVADLFNGHPLARAPLPDSAAIRKLPVSAIDQFRGRRYQPGGSVLVLAGGVDDASAQTARAAFAGWTGRAGHLQVPPVDPPGELNVRLVGTRSSVATLALSFMVDANTPDAVATLDVMAERVRRRVQAGLARVGLTTSPSVITSAPAGAGFLTVIAQAPAQQIDPAWRAMVQATVGEAGGPISAAEFATLKAEIGARAERIDASPEGEARRWAATRSRWPEARTWQTGLGMLGPDELAEVEQRALRISRASAVILAPDASRTDDDEPWLRALVEQATRIARPDGGLAPGRHTLAEGLDVIVHPMPGARRVGIALWLAGGARTVPPRHAGLAALVAKALAQPAPGEPAIEATPHADGIELRCEVPAGGVDGALRALTRRIRALRWTPATLEAARARPTPVLPDLLARADGLAVYGTPETRARITPSIARRWTALHVQQAPVSVSFAGAIERQHLSGLDLRFGPRQPAKSTGVKPRYTTVERPVDAPAGQLLRRWHFAASQQAAVALVFAMLDAPDTATRAALAGVGARLQVELTPTTATARLRAPRKRYNAAIAALESGLDGLRTLAIDGDLLAQARQRFTAAERVRLRRPGARAAWLLAQHRAGMQLVGPDAVDAWVATLEGVSAKDVARSAREDLVRARRAEVRLVPGRRPR